MTAWNKFPHDLNQIICHFKQDLVNWNVENFGNIYNEIKRTKIN